jgi:pyruvate/2-oxoglutarate dehydrogenase complex dihydrolipoamide acyltransferase (E2) component
LQQEKESVFASHPSLGRWQKNKMIDITRIKGTGPDGRIVKEDIEKVLETQRKGQCLQKREPALFTRAGR